MPRIHSVALTCLLATACATAQVSSTSSESTRGPRLETGPRPDWVSGSSREFPRSRYLVGVGFGDHQEAASSRAKAAIAQIFSVDVDARIDVAETETSTTGSHRAPTSEGRISVSEDIRTVSRTVLEGVEIAAYWTDRETVREYALAVLDRAHALRVVRDRLGEIDRSLVALDQRMGSEPDRLARVKAAVQLQSALVDRGALIARERILDPAGAATPLPLGEQKLRADIRRVLGELVVTVRFEGERSTDVATAVIDALAQLGFGARLATGPSAEADLHVGGVLESRPLDGGTESGVVFARSIATLSVKEPRTDAVVAQITESEKDASRSLEEAVRRSSAALARRLSPRIHSALLDYLQR